MHFFCQIQFILESIPNNFQNKLRNSRKIPAGSAASGKNHRLGQSSFCMKTFHLMIINGVPNILTLHKKGTKIRKIIVLPIAQRQV